MPKVTKFIKDPKANYDLPSDTDIRVTVGTRLRELRKAHRMSQKELAVNIGKNSAAYIAFIESGERRISAVDLALIASHLKVKLSYFYP